MSANAQEEETRRARPAAELLRCEAPLSLNINNAGVDLTLFSFALFLHLVFLIPPRASFLCAVLGFPTVLSNLLLLLSYIVPPCRPYRQTVRMFSGFWWASAALAGGWLVEGR